MKRLSFLRNRVTIMAVVLGAYPRGSLVGRERRLRRGEQVTAFGKRQAKFLKNVVVTLDHGEGNGNIGCFNAITFQARFDDQFHGFLPISGTLGSIARHPAKSQPPTVLRALQTVPELSASTTKDHQELFDEGIDYGADVTITRDGNIPAAPQYSWGTFPILMEKTSEVVEGLKAGTQLLDEHVAKLMRKQGI